MKEIRDAVEYFKKDEWGKYTNILIDLAEKVLAAKMPEKRECPSEFCSTEADAKNAEWNQAIDQCTLAITGALLSVEDIEKILSEYSGIRQCYVKEARENIANSIHSAQMEKLGGVR